MKIAIVSKLWEHTSSDSTGGTGASIGTLVDGLVERGHRVTLFATGKSKTKAQKLVSVRKDSYREGDYSEIHEYENIANAFRAHKKFDIIHCAVEQKSVLFGDLVKTPSLHSIRYGEFWEHELNLLKKYKRLNFMANSRAIKNKWKFLNWRGAIYNGVDLGRFKYSAKHDDYFLYLARLTPQKRPDIAIQIARKLKKKLIIAGSAHSSWDKDYLEKKVFPFIDGKQIKYFDEVNRGKTIGLLRGAKALIQPNEVFEACSNTIIEALSCGTPTIAFDNGSNKELIKNKKTGFIVRDANEMLKAVRSLDLINRADCRARAEKFFSKEKMVDEYLKLYRRLIKK